MICGGKSGDAKVFGLRFVPGSPHFSFFFSTFLSFLNFRIGDEDSF